MKNDIEIIRGTTNKVVVHLKDSNGNPYTPASGEKLVFGIKKKPHHEECVLKKVLSGGTNSYFTFQFDPEETENLEYGKYFYDVGLRSGNAYYSVIPPSVFNIVANITKRGDGA